MGRIVGKVYKKGRGGKSANKDQKDEKQEQKDPEQEKKDEKQDAAEGDGKAETQKEGE